MNKFIILQKIREIQLSILEKKDQRHLKNKTKTVSNEEEEEKVWVEVWGRMRVKAWTLLWQPKKATNHYNNKTKVMIYHYAERIFLISVLGVGMNWWIDFLYFYFHFRYRETFKWWNHNWQSFCLYYYLLYKANREAQIHIQASSLKSIACP